MIPQRIIHERSWLNTYRSSSSFEMIFGVEKITVTLTYQKCNWKFKGPKQTLKGSYSQTRDKWLTWARGILVRRSNSTCTSEKQTTDSTGRTREFKAWEIVNRKENLVTSAIVPNQRISKRNKCLIVSFWHELWFPLVAENESRET